MFDFNFRIKPAKDFVETTQIDEDRFKQWCADKGYRLETTGVNVLFAVNNKTHVGTFTNDTAWTDDKII